MCFMPAHLNHLVHFELPGFFCSRTCNTVYARGPFDVHVPRPVARSCTFTGLP